jgi:hypothetical protein
MASYCGVPEAVGELFNYSPTFQGIPLGEFGRRDPRVPSVPTNRSWVQQGIEDEDDSQQKSASNQDFNSWGVIAPESDSLKRVSAVRGVNDTVDHPYQTFNRNIELETLRIHNSLGREMLNDWSDAAYNVGGIGYGYDTTNPTGVHWASSPGYKGDAYDPQYNPQIYMRPGIKLVQGFSNLGAVPPGQMPRSVIPPR